MAQCSIWMLEILRIQTLSRGSARPSRALYSRLKEAESSFSSKPTTKWKNGFSNGKITACLLPNLYREGSCSAKAGAIRKGIRTLKSSERSTDLVKMTKEELFSWQYVEES